MGLDFVRVAYPVALRVGVVRGVEMGTVLGWFDVAFAVETSHFGFSGRKKARIISITKSTMYIIHNPT